MAVLFGGRGGGRSGIGGTSYDRPACPRRLRCTSIMQSPNSSAALAAPEPKVLSEPAWDGPEIRFETSSNVRSVIVAAAFSATLTTDLC